MGKNQSGPVFQIGNLGLHFRARRIRTVAAIATIFLLAASLTLARSAAM